MTAFKTATDKTKAEAAVQMVIMDAMAKGHTDKNDIIAYMQSETFENAVKRYIDLMNENKTKKTQLQ